MLIIPYLFFSNKRKKKTPRMKKLIINLLLLLFVFLYKSEAQSSIQFKNPIVKEVKCRAEFIITQVELTDSFTIIKFFFNKGSNLSLYYSISSNATLLKTNNKKYSLIKSIGVTVYPEALLINKSSFWFTLFFPRINDSLTEIDIKGHIIQFDSNKTPYGIPFKFNGVKLINGVNVNSNSSLAEQLYGAKFPDNAKKNQIISNNDSIKKIDQIDYDVIYFKDGKEIKSKVIEVGVSDIKYRDITNIEGPLYTVAKSDLLMIIYKNGNRDNFKVADNINNKSTEVVDFCIKGNNDAHNLYSFSNASTFWSTFLFFPIGFVTTIAVSATPPKEYKLMPLYDERYKTNNDYKSCFRNTAHSKKKSMGWLCWWFNFGYYC